MFRIGSRKNEYISERPTFAGCCSPRCPPGGLTESLCPVKIGFQDPESMDQLRLWSVPRPAIPAFVAPPTGVAQDCQQALGTETDGLQCPAGLTL